jgi:hypothetical protein
MAAVGLVLTFADPTQAQGTKPVAKDFGWHSDLETAKAAARRSGKPLFVVFRCEA